MSETYRGVFPVVPTPFSDFGELDLEGQKRVLDCMVEQGVDGMCILANYSEQFLLSDIERETLVKLCLGHVAGRVSVIVTCSHFSSVSAVERVRQASHLGEDMIMLIPAYHGATLNGTEEGILDQFKHVGEAAELPIMVQVGPLSSFELSVPFLIRMAKAIEQVRYFKIETPGTAGKLCALFTSGGSIFEGPFDGEEAITLMADLNAGATGTISSALLPDVLSDRWLNCITRARSMTRRGIMPVSYH